MCLGMFVLLLQCLGASHFPIVEYHPEDRLEALDKRRIFKHVEHRHGVSWFGE